MAYEQASKGTGREGGMNDIKKKITDLAVEIRSVVIEEDSPYIVFSAFAAHISFMVATGCETRQNADESVNMLIEMINSHLKKAEANNMTNWKRH